VKPETRSFYEAAVRSAVEHVVASLDEALDLARLARDAALSPFHFHRIFRGMVSETPLELHRRLRLERAAARLADPATSVTSIAFDAGYDSHEAFSRVFRSFYACSPSDFRQARLAERASCVRGPQLEIAARSGIHYRADQSMPVITYDLGARAMNVEIQQLPERRVATVHHVGPYSRISEAFGRLGEVAGRAGLFQSRPEMLAIYHDDPETTPESELSSDAGVVVGDGVQIPEGLREQRLPAGRYARTVHVGPYEELGDAWARFMGQWLAGSGERMGAGNTFEIYLNTPQDVPKKDLRTELYIPLA
jgi:AraC family transcriptional regulator